MQSLTLAHLTGSLVDKQELGVDGLVRGPLARLAALVLQNQPHVRLVARVVDVVLDELVVAQVENLEPPAHVDYHQLVPVLGDVRDVQRLRARQPGPRRDVVVDEVAVQRGDDEPLVRLHRLAGPGAVFEQHERRLGHLDPQRPCRLAVAVGARPAQPNHHVDVGELPPGHVVEPVLVLGHRVEPDAPDLARVPLHTETDVGLQPWHVDGEGVHDDRGRVVVLVDDQEQLDQRTPAKAAVGGLQVGHPERLWLEPAHIERLEHRAQRDVHQLGAHVLDPHHHPHKLHGDEGGPVDQERQVGDGHQRSQQLQSQPVHRGKVVLVESLGRAHWGYRHCGLVVVPQAHRELAELPVVVDDRGHQELGVGAYLAHDAVVDAGGDELFRQEELEVFGGGQGHQGCLGEGSGGEIGRTRVILGGTG